ncbi:hypothetical protein F4778DRAFT_723474 [Xylariomycetidae sp. FL2044]|nr:hypothetical protein F4778DRAFT_723474 [Xylariomycetidae sp. FL2044]
MIASLTFLFVWLQTAGALLLGKTRNCSEAVRDIDLAAHNATFLNATYYKPSGLNVSGTVNTVSLCEIYASINYAPGAQLFFALWLPDFRQYQSRFLAVGDDGFAGAIDYVNMMRQLNSGLGFAVAGGDSGHNAYTETNGSNSGTPGSYIPIFHHEDDRVRRLRSRRLGVHSLLVQTCAVIRDGLAYRLL